MSTTTQLALQSQQATKEFSHMRSLVLTALAAASLALGGCAGMSNHDQRVLSGAAIGGVVGHAVLGGTGGAVAGAVVGGVVGDSVDRDARDREQRDRDYRYNDCRRYNSEEFCRRNVR